MAGEAEKETYYGLSEPERDSYFGLRRKLIAETGFSESVLKHLVRNGEFDTEIRSVCPHYKYGRMFGYMLCDLDLFKCKGHGCMIYWLHKFDIEKDYLGDIK